MTCHACKGKLRPDGTCVMCGRQNIAVALPPKDLAFLRELARRDKATLSDELAALVGYVRERYTLPEIPETEERDRHRGHYANFSGKEAR